MLKSAPLTEGQRADVLTGLVHAAAHFDPAAAERCAAAQSPRFRSGCAPGLRRLALLHPPCRTDRYAPPAPRYEAEMPPLPGVDAVDVDLLERSTAQPSTRRRAEAPAGRDDDAKAAAAEGEGKRTRTKPKAKRKRKPLLPKGYDPENPGPMPDPERWLPRCAGRGVEGAGSGRGVRAAGQRAEGAGRTVWARGTGRSVPRRVVARAPSPPPSPLDPPAGSDRPPPATCPPQVGAGRV